jgi:hypothetical protein
MFYPQHPETIRRDVEDMLARVEQKPVSGRVRGLISPHAGYMYSGYTAAHGFAQLRASSCSVVAVVSPSHREYFDGISIYEGDGYSTPFGEVEVDAELRAKLLEHCPHLRMSEVGHRDEHAIEVQLPFLQLVLPEFRFLPIVLGDQKREYCFELGKALSAVLPGEEFLLIASTDLSHYHASDLANKLDSIFIRDVHKFDYERLMSDLESGKTEACGGGPTVAVMVALHGMGITKMEVLHHCNSGDVTGDTDKVVGYLSAVAHA